MGRKVDVLLEIRKKINRFRRLEYYLQRDEIDEETLETILDFLHNIVSDTIFDIIDMDIQESKTLEDWGIMKIRQLAQKLRIPNWGREARDILISQIKNHEVAIQLYFPSYTYIKEEDQDGSTGTTPSSEAGKGQRRRNKNRTEEIRAKISEPFNHGSSFGDV